MAEDSGKGSIADKVFGVVLEIVGDAGKYASLVYGISEFVKDNKAVDKFVYAGFVYCFASILSKTGYTLRSGGISGEDSGSTVKSSEINRDDSGSLEGKLKKE